MEAFYVGRRPLVQTGLFPSSRYAVQLSQGEAAIRRIPGFVLLREYARSNSCVPGHGWRTMLTMVLGQLRNVLLYIMVVDVGTIGRLVSGNRAFDLIRLGVTIFVLSVILYAWEIAKAAMDLTGRSRLYLQTLVMRRYTAFTEDARTQVLSCDLQREIMLDAERVAQGYAAMIDCCEVVGALVMTCYFILTIRPGACWVPATLPVIATLFSCCLVLRGAQSGAHTKEGEVCRLIRQICIQRTFDGEQFYESVQELMSAKHVQERSGVHLRYLPRLLGACGCSIYVMTSGQAVLGGSLSLDSLVSTLAVTVLISFELSEAIPPLTKLHLSIEPLRQLAVYLNMPVDHSRFDEVA